MIHITYPWMILNQLFITCKAKMKNKLVSENEDDERNLQPGDCKFIFLISLIKFFK